MTRDIRPFLLPGIILFVALGTIVAGVLTPRDLSLGEDAGVFTSSGNLFASGVSRTFTYAVLYVSAGAITAFVIRRGFPRAGLSLWASYLSFVLLNFVLPGFAGEVPGIDVRLLLPPIAFTAVYFAQPMEADGLVRLCKGVLCGFIYGSLLAAVLIPAQALAMDYAGIIPALGVRLYGVGGGAASLGAQSAAYLAIETVSPSRSRMRVIHLLAAAAVLLLTQSKTSWFFVLLGAFYLLSRRIVRWLYSPANTGGTRGVWKTLFLSCYVVACIVLVSRLVDDVSAGFLENRGNVQTLTGRTHIWTTSIRVWLDNPVFGYGNGLWEDDGFRAEHGSYAHAHNQFIHSLGGAGLVGLIGLLIYLRSAWTPAMREARTNAVPLVLLLLLLTLSLTDVPLRSHYLLDSFALLHLILFALLMQSEKRKETRAAPPAPEPTPMA